MKLKENDYVKLVKVEPHVLGKVIQVFDEKIVFVRWEDGLNTTHYVDELRLVRLEEISGPWMGF